jgi:hypothetical protein
MARNQRIARTALVVASLLTSVFSVGTARAQGPPAYAGTFTLTNQIHWGKTALQPGTYTIIIKSTADPVIASIRNAEGDAVCFVMSRYRSEKTNGVNALLIKEKEGQLKVHSLALADLGIVLIYDPGLPREAVQEARASHSVPVIWAKK